MTLHGNLLMFGALVCAMETLAPARARGDPEPGPYPVDRIPMRSEVDVDAKRYFVGENFPITVRIANPNPYDVYLAGFEFGALEPHTEILIPGAEGFQDCSHGGTIDVIGGPPVLIRAKGHIEHRRLVYTNTRLEGYCLSLAPGVYQLRMKSSVGAVMPQEPPRHTGVDWNSQVIEFVLIMPSGRDLTALHFLRERTRQLVQHLSDPDPEGVDCARFELESYRQFLERFSGTVYTPEIRWRVAKLLRSGIGSRHAPLDDEPGMVELWEECLTFCLDRGGAYADEFLEWEDDRNGGRPIGLMERSAKYKRFELLKRIVDELDRKYPENEEASLYRRIFVEGETGSLEEARRIAADLADRFPDSQYVRAAKGTLRYLERQSKTE